MKKLKEYKEKTGILESLKDIFFSQITDNETAVYIDTKGSVIIEDFRKIIDYNSEKLVIETKNKKLCICGKQLIITSCSKHSAICKGEISRIEFYTRG